MKIRKYENIEKYLEKCLTVKPQKKKKSLL